MPTETPERGSRPHLSVGRVLRPHCGEDLGGGMLLCLLGNAVCLSPKPTCCPSVGSINGLYFRNINAIPVWSLKRGQEGWCPPMSTVLPESRSVCLSVSLSHTHTHTHTPQSPHSPPLSWYWIG